jgi:hypothetical protein
VFVHPDVLLEKLQLQLLQSGNWSAKLPAGYTGAETLRRLEEAENEKQDQILIHPSGHLELRQNLVPFNKTIEKLGNSFMERQASYQIADYTFGEGNPVSLKTQKPILDYFSRGQFEDLPDSEKLSTPDFDLMSAGIEVAPGQIFDFSPDIRFTASDFEDIILGETGSSKAKSSNTWQGERTMNLRGTKKIIDAARPEELFGVVEDVPVQKEKVFKILSKESLESPAQLKTQHFYSYSGAKDYLKKNWPEDQQRAWQILQAEPEENEEVVIT